MRRVFKGVYGSLEFAHIACILCLYGCVKISSKRFCLDNTIANFQIQLVSPLDLESADWEVCFL